VGSLVFRGRSWDWDSRIRIKGYFFSERVSYSVKATTKRGENEKGGSGGSSSLENSIVPGGIVEREGRDRKLKIF